MHKQESPGRDQRQGSRNLPRHYEGLFHGLQVASQVDDNGVLRPAYAMQLAEQMVDLDAACGLGVSLAISGTQQCIACEAGVIRRYGGGYCYDCFTTLARCDLCYVSPDRCHHHLGTCREPEWGTQHCMQPHSVYLAVTSGPKVGITRQGREQRRWIDQGATAALKIIDAPTRRDAGLVEAELSKQLNDRTDWKKMLAGRVQSYDLAQLARQLQARTRDFTALSMAEQSPHREDASADTACDIAWQIDPAVTQIAYPVIERSPGVRLSLPVDGAELRDNLLGVQGGYLLFSTGVLALGDYRGNELSLTISEPIAGVGDTDQLALF